MEWLNEDSRDFLKNGYLLEGVEPEERIRQIADRSEEILGIDGFARKFYDHMSKGWYSLASPIWANFGLSRGLPISCLVGDSWINVRTGAKQIKDLEIGDEVLTHKGRWKKVIDKQCRQSNDDIYEIKTRMTPIRITGNHPVLTNRGWVRVDELDETNDFIATNNKITWTPKEHSINKKSGSYLIDEELAWAIGLWFAEGSISGKKLRLTMRPSHRDTIKKWEEIMTRRFGVNSTYHESDCITVNINSESLGKFFLEEFGSKDLSLGLKEMHIPELKALLRGFYIGDGNVSNPKLAMSLYEVGLKCGYKMGLNIKRKPGVYYCSEGSDECLRYVPFKMKKLNHNERVYDITVEDDHSFSVAGVVVHNCYGSFIEDSMIGILDTAREVGMMSKYGGGTSGYFGDVRGRGAPITNNGFSEGAVNFMRLFNTMIDVTKQGGTRRGSFAAYLPIDHPDIDEFLAIKTEGNPIQGIFTGVNVSDEWMQSMIDGDVEKRNTWAKVLRMRSEIGLPYIFFTDNVNNNSPDVYQDKGMKIHASNLCSEIALSSDEGTSFVCDLSSMNVAKYDEWKDTDAVEVLIYFLDAVMTEFIEFARKIPGYEKAVNFARQQRALGLGVLGWHDYLQSNSIPFDSYAAMRENNAIFKTISERALQASKELADLYGEPPLLEGYGRRNTTLMAIAPTTSSAFILGQTSQSIEPYRSNYFVKDLAKKKVTIRNCNLEKVLEEKGCNDEETWMSILENGGSVQHLDCLSDHEKDVFKTFSEISQLAVVQQAAQRQKYIDQSQSLNLMIHPDTPLKDINSLHIDAWKLGVKTLYYQHSVNAAQEFNKDLLTCSACEG